MPGQEINYEPKFLLNESARTDRHWRQRIESGTRICERLAWVEWVDEPGVGGGVHVLGTSMHGTLRRVVTERFRITETHTHTHSGTRSKAPSTHGLTWKTQGDAGQNGRRLT